MMIKRSVKGEIVLKYLDKHPNMENKKLARKIFEENKEVFKSVDRVRGMIRYYKGQNGDHNRSLLATKRHFKHNNYELPEPDEPTYAPFILPLANNNIVLFGDVHLPFHNLDAINLIFDYIHEHKPNTIYLNGDIVDFYEASFFEKDPRKRKLSAEIKDFLIPFLKQLRKQFPYPTIYYKFGNHEYRWERYLKRQAPILFDFDEFRLEVICELASLGIIPIQYMQVAKVGKLWIIHGHEYRGGNANLVNPARWLFLKAKDNTICNHFHKVSEHIENTISQDIRGGWSVGHLSETNPEYMPLNNWCHGFAHIKIKQDGNFSVYNKKIIEGRIQ